MHRTPVGWTHTHFSNLWICSSLYANSVGKLMNDSLSLTMNKKRNEYTLTKQNIHTASKPVFTIMLMNCHYLLQQYLHLLTAERGTGGQSSNVTKPRYQGRFKSLSTSCHWPAPLQAWPVLSADGPVGSETPGCRLCI